MGASADLTSPDPAAAIVVGTTIALTILFDLADLRPLVGSFRFLGSRTYWLYLLLRLAVALAAAGLIARTGQVPDWLVGFAAVFGGLGVYAPEQAEATLAEVSERHLNNPGLRRRIYANMIASANQVYARSLLEQSGRLPPPP